MSCTVREEACITRQVSWRLQDNGTGFKTYREAVTRITSVRESTAEQSRTKLCRSTRRQLSAFESLSKDCSQPKLFYWSLVLKCVEAAEISDARAAAAAADGTIPIQEYY